MQLSEDIAPGTYISNYTQGMITIGGNRYQHNVLITPDGTVARWELTDLQQLDIRHCQTILKFKPEVVLIGSYDHNLLPDPQWVEYFATHHLGIEIMNTAAACRTYNILLAENRLVVAGLIVA